jgi:hypothetical protein
MNICRLATEELRTRAGIHRELARFEPAYQSDPRALTKNELMASTQTVLAEVYEELVMWREKEKGR